MAIPLWAAVFGTLYQLMILIWGIVKFPSFISFCRGANISGSYEFVKNALLLSLFSYAPLTVISITFMWVSYDKEWGAGVVFVMLPILSILIFMLFLLATVNDITKSIDVNRRGRKRLPMQAPATLVVASPQQLNASMMSTPPRALSMPPELPLQATPM